MYFDELAAAYDRQRRERNIYHDLMRFRVREVLLVGSLFDSFIVESDGVLTEQIYGEYFKLNLSTVPRIVCAYSEESALDLFRPGGFDLVILMAGLDFDLPLRLAQDMKRLWPEVPILLLATNNSSLERLDMREPALSAVDRVFVWNGYSKLFVGMIKYVEDLKNAEADTAAAQVRVILLIEDSVRYYSRFLPVLYKVVLRQTQNLIEEERVAETYKLLSIRARPKILLASSYEKALEIFNTYEANLLTVITDLRFPRDGKYSDEAGFDFLRMAKSRVPDLPVLVQSSEQRVREKAYALGASFADKNSESLEMELAAFLQENLGFGAFRFRLPDGSELRQAKNMKEFVEILHVLPPESLAYHGARNHFSAWLMARGEIQMAKVLRPYRVSDFPSLAAMRDLIVHIIDDVKKEKSRGIVPHFDETMMREENYMSRLVDGSVGGKGRGLIFIRSLLENLDFSRYIKGLDIKIPRSVFIGIDEFENFLESHNLWASAYYGPQSGELKKTFLSMPLSQRLVSQLRSFLASTGKPLAVRSSGLFEDMLMVPFSGVYDTYVVPNNHPDFEVRLNQLCDAVRLIYASLFSSNARAYFEATGYNLEEERMAVIVQELVGARHGDYYYPQVSGVAQSYNYYPVSYTKPEDGLCLAALGLGTWVVGGGSAQRFCPRYPKVDILAPDQALENTQRFFHALDMGVPTPELSGGEMSSIKELPIAQAAADRYFSLLASTWDPEDMRFVPGNSGKGALVIDLANILKHEALPFAEAVSMILDIGARSMGTPVEIEYALNLDEEGGKPALYILQLKPLTRRENKVSADLLKIDKDRCFISSRKTMGNGSDYSLRDIVWVEPELFDRSKTMEMAAEIEAIDAELKKEGKHCLLIGPGRWGTRDRWLGIPVTFAQISRAKFIVEADLADFAVESSQGSHFFHNLTSMNIGYMKVPGSGGAFIDWAWLRSMPLRKAAAYCRWTSLDNPIRVEIDGKAGRALVLKPSPPDAPTAASAAGRRGASIDD